MLVRVALIANPRSGKVGRDPQQLSAMLVSEGAREVTVCAVDEIDNARSCAPERIVLAGGDGSIAPSAALAGDLGVPLAVLPVGTANDFARAMELPRELEEAVKLAVTGRRTVGCELGAIDHERPFVNVASAGLASVAAKRAKPLKPRFGVLAYGIGAARAGATASPLQIEVRADSRDVFRGGAWQLIVACTGAFGGGSGVGETDAGDGLLDLVVIPAGSRFRLAQRAWGLRAKSISEQQGVLSERAATLEVTTLDGTSLELNVDGELVERSTAATFSARANAFELVVPG